MSRAGEPPICHFQNLQRTRPTTSESIIDFLSITLDSRWNTILSFTIESITLQGTDLRETGL